MRRWDRERDDDPLGGMVNLFDLWIVVVVGLILALVGTMSSREAESSAAATDASSTPANLPAAQLRKLPHYRKSESTLSGRGERLGTAYRLESGEVVYVPGDGESHSSRITP